MSDPDENEDNEENQTEAEPEEIEAPDLVSIREGYSADKPKRE